MEQLIHPILNELSAQDITEKLLSIKCDWQDGKKTAGSHAIKVKNNLQLNRSSSLSIELTNKISDLLISDPLVKSYAIPKKIHGLMFTKSGPNQGYGMHVDNPYMHSGRSDLSFTLFLSKKDNYEGGSLCIQTMQDTKKVKLNAGEMVIYPSTSLHSVEAVKKGERIVCVGWIESYVSSNEERNYLFSLEAGAKGILAKHGRSAELDLVFQSYSNLLKRLGD